MEIFKNEKIIIINIILINTYYFFNMKIKQDFYMIYVE